MRKGGQMHGNSASERVALMPPSLLGYEFRTFNMERKRKKSVVDRNEIVPFLDMKKVIQGRHQSWLVPSNTNYSTIL